ncbi:hypothetical protein ACL02R_20915 [Streptomyces sp. MS19]|uniref:hypothetical protein n=1 Tax=Streptomyces sp. MS19 TaxID=3385972 RepID=UPI0039A1903F
MDAYTPLSGLKKLGPWNAMPITCADGQMNVLARRVEESRERIALVDGDDRIVAVVVCLPELEDLEDDLAIARNTVARLEGKEPTPHEEFMKQLEAGEWAE